MKHTIALALTLASCGGEVSAPPPSGVAGSPAKTCLVYALTRDIGNCGEVVAPIDYYDAPTYCTQRGNERSCTRPDGRYWPFALGSDKAHWVLTPTYVTLHATRGVKTVCFARYNVQCVTP